MSIDIDNVKIAWQPPTETGGSPITGYSVDFREWGREVWSPVTALTAKTTLRVSNLRKRASYQFRVIAENVIGSGKALVSAKCTTAYSYGLFCLFNELFTVFRLYFYTSCWYILLAKLV